MFEVLFSVPAYSSNNFSGLTEEGYKATVANFTKDIARAEELFNAYWKTGNVALYNMSLEALLRAHTHMVILVDRITNEKITSKLGRRATFMYDLAAVMIGAN